MNIRQLLDGESAEGRANIPLFRSIELAVGAVRSARSKVEKNIERHRFSEEFKISPLGGVEREMGLEPTTTGLEIRHSTIELFPLATL